MTAAVDEKATGELTVGGGFSTDAGALLNAGLRERNLIGTGIDAGLNGVLAQRRSEIDLSVTDPYFLDRNLVAGFDLFHVQNNNQDIAHYSERRTGCALRLGYEFNEHLRQAWTYSLVDRNVYNVQTGASIYIQNQPASRCCRRSADADARLPRQPHGPAYGFVLRLAPTRGPRRHAHYVRTKLDGTYFIPLERLTGDSDWGIAISAGAGYLLSSAARRRSSTASSWAATTCAASSPAAPGRTRSASGRQRSAATASAAGFIYTQSTELRFPLPISADLGLSGRAFVDVGGLSSQVSRSPRRRWRPDAERTQTPARRRRRRRVLEDAVRPDQHRPGAGRGQTAIRPDPVLPVWLRHEVLN